MISSIKPCLFCSMFDYDSLFHVSALEARLPPECTYYVIDYFLVLRALTLRFYSGNLLHEVRATRISIFSEVVLFFPEISVFLPMQVLLQAFWLSYICLGLHTSFSGLSVEFSLETMHWHKICIISSFKLPLQYCLFLRQNIAATNAIILNEIKVYAKSRLSAEKKPYILLGGNKKCHDIHPLQYLHLGNQSSHPYNGF